MEITLEKIELVKDRTGATYREAKEALEAADGSVVDAIIDIEENINTGKTANENETSKNKTLVNAIKKAVKKGNVSRLVIKRGENVILNVPLSISVLGAVVAPWGAIFGIIAALGYQCQIEFVNDKGEITDINGSVKKKYGHAKEVGLETVDKIKDSELYNDIRFKGQDAFDDIRDMGQDALNQIKKNEKIGEIKKKSSEILRKAKENIEDSVSDIQESDIDDASSEVDEILKEEE